MQQERRQPGPGQPGPGTGRAALAAAAVMLALTFWGRGLALVLAGTLAGPLPALRTALERGQMGQAEQPGGADSAASGDSGPASSTVAACKNSRT